MLLLAPLLLLPLLQASPQWGFGGFGGFSPYSRRGSYSSGYSGYGSPMAEPEPEPEPISSRYRPGPSASLQSSSSPRLTRRLASSRQETGQFPQLSTTNSRTFGNFGSRKSSEPSSRFGTRAQRFGTTRKPPVRLIPTRAPVTTTRRPSRTTQAPRRTTQEPRRTTLRSTRRTTLRTTRSPPPPSQTTRRPPLPATTPEKRRNLEPLLPAASGDFIDDVFEAFEDSSVSLRTNSRVVESAWKVPASLMAVAAVPGAPVIQGDRGEARLPRDPSQQQPPVMMDPYLEFMPVPAVPDPSIMTQEARRPKDGLSSLDINLSLQNTIQPGGPATKAPAAEEDRQEDRQEERRKFKRCQGRCVQQFCLPVDNLTVYEKCVDKCKQFCT